MREELVFTGGEDVFDRCLERSGEVRVALVESALEPVPGLALGFCAYFFDSHVNSFGSAWKRQKYA